MSPFFQTLVLTIIGAIFLDFLIQFYDKKGEQQQKEYLKQKGDDTIAQII